MYSVYYVGFFAKLPADASYALCMFVSMLYLWLVSTKIAEEASTKRTPFFSCQNAVWSAISELLCPILSYQNVTCSLQKLQQKSSLMPKAYIDFVTFQGRGKRGQNVLHISLVRSRKVANVDKGVSEEIW